ncbi:YrdB family protein [Fictibacillus enclensis]|nr:YrdB family protein [Fictibacillus enclensis]
MMLAIVKPVLLAVMFMSELFALGVFGFWGYQLTSGFEKYILCLAAPLFVAFIWGTFLSPKAALLLPPLWRKALQLIVFAAAAVALYSTGFPLISWIFIILSSIVLLLIRFLKF